MDNQNDALVWGLAWWDKQTEKEDQGLGETKEFNVEKTGWTWLYWWIESGVTKAWRSQKRSEEGWIPKGWAEEEKNKWVYFTAHRAEPWLNRAKEALGGRSAEDQ
jgi:hypothetical protein